MYYNFSVSWWDAPSYPSLPPHCEEGRVGIKICQCTDWVNVTNMLFNELKMRHIYNHLTTMLRGMCMMAMYKT